MNSRPNHSDNPLVKAFFLGRAVAELVSENVEKATTELLSEIGKFDAEQRVNIRDFVEQVQVRADQAMSQAASTGAETTANSTSGSTANGGNSTDLQATIDDLRAEVAAARTELQRYRSTTS